MKKEHLMEREQLYRNNVSLITFRGTEFLLVNLLEWPSDCWKFPQGGVNPKESLKQAAKREFQEELGTDKMIIIRKSKIKRKYKWKEPKLIRGKEYLGQRQTFFLVEFLGADDDIMLNSDEIRSFCWCNIANLENMISRDDPDFQDYWGTIRNILKEQGYLYYEK